VCENLNLRAAGRESGWGSTMVGVIVGTVVGQRTKPLSLDGAPAQNRQPWLGDQIPARAHRLNLDNSEVQPSPFDKLRAGSTGLSLACLF
jgi:hypothetical protein